MSIFSTLGKGIGSLTGSIGGALGHIPILGKAIATPFNLASGLGKLVGGQNAGQAFGDYAKGVGTTAALTGAGFAAPALLGAGGASSLGKLGQYAGAGALNGNGAGGGGLLGLLSGGGGVLSNLGKLGQIGLAGAGALSGAKSSSQANAINQALLARIKQQQALQDALGPMIQGRLTAPGALQQQLPWTGNPFAPRYGKLQ